MDKSCSQGFLDLLKEPERGLTHRECNKAKPGIDWLIGFGNPTSKIEEARKERTAVAHPLQKGSKRCPGVDMFSKDTGDVQVAPIS